MLFDAVEACKIDVAARGTGRSPHADATSGMAPSTGSLSVGDASGMAASVSAIASASAGLSDDPVPDRISKSEAGTASAESLAAAPHSDPVRTTVDAQAQMRWNCRGILRGFLECCSSQIDDSSEQALANTYFATTTLELLSSRGENHDVKFTGSVLSRVVLVLDSRLMAIHYSNFCIIANEDIVGQEVSLLCYWLCWQEIDSCWSPVTALRGSFR